MRELLKTVLCVALGAAGAGGPTPPFTVWTERGAVKTVAADIDPFDLAVAEANRRREAVAILQNGQLVVLVNPRR